jgi:hypothetical protein
MFILKESPWVSNYFKSVYDDSGDGTGEGGGDGAGEGDGGSGETLTISSFVEKHGLQDELNGMMSANRKKLTLRNTELVTQLQTLGEQSKMSTQAREELEERIEELQTQFMSKEELAKREADKSATAHATEIEKLTGEATAWQSRFASSTTQRSLLDAAVEGEAVQPSQIVLMLGQTTQLVEETDSVGHGTGQYRTIVKFNDHDSEGNPITLDLVPSEAIKRMKELPALYGNLFKGNNNGGVGESNNADGGAMTQPKLMELLKDPVAYRKWRKENPDLDITKLR